MAVAELPSWTKNGIAECAQTEKASVKERDDALLDKLLPSDFSAQAKKLVRDVRHYCEASGGILRYSQKETTNGNVLMVSVKDGADKESHNEFKLHIHPTGEVELWKKAYFHATKEQPVTVSGVVHESDFILSKFVKGMNFRGRLGFRRAKPEKVFETIQQELVKQHPELPVQTAKINESRLQLA